MNQNVSALEKQTMKKVSRRIIPFIFLMYIVSYLDRANIGYASLEMNKALGLTSEMFGIASGIFFIGYFLFEVPSNVLMERFGAKVWIARILITWGIISVATIFAQDAWHLYLIRFLLGVAEAGFFPGIILYLTFWFRSKELAKTIAMFMTAIPVSYIIGGPLSTWIMDHVQWFGMSGWRWMFVLEGAPAIILGVVSFFYLTERPADAKWLTAQERKWLIDDLQKNKEPHEENESEKQARRKALADPRVWSLAIIYFVYITGTLGIAYWMPQIIKGFSSSLSNTQIGLISTVPYIVASVVMNYWSHRSDRKQERYIHAAGPLLIAAVSLVGAGMTSNPVVAMVLITASLTTMYCFKGPFWALPPKLLTPAMAAVGIAVINSIGNLGGFLGPYAIGALKDATGSTFSGLVFLSIMMIVAFLMLIVMRSKMNKAAKDQISSEQEDIFGA
ncbi:MFS transporter, ACS family, tartrate transporter [Fictibacillus solisalsi]|uniref:MFS transporter, ACS family, tartrate transporter n=1 Tax=Fictibacillus solisalsi TaxID=459525 RepID=A0A1G9TZD5_9BACL|nr:MFS transporter [Fictibacillus solisalsi]SDM52943.1 MFS transporter, ACS family, tartrate transporter [Fictibacillus solisalsi]